ncbi:MAG: type II secretion system F family protein [Spirochaetota bacterium]
MPVYEYRALNARGRTVSGIIDASGPEGARTRLKGRGLFVQNIAEARKGGGRLTLSGRGAATAHLTRQLAFLMSAQVPLVAALDGVVEQLGDQRIKRVAADIRERIKEGQSVSQAFGAHPEYFNRMYVHTLHAGEASGHLERAFRRLAGIFDKNRALMAKLRSSLTYPVVLLFFSLLVIVFLVSFIVPTFAGLFEEFGQTLPLPTRLVIGVSDLFTSWWWLFFFIAASLWLAARRAYRTEGGRRYFDRLALRLPVAGRLLADTFRIRFAHTMSLLLGSGVGMIEALENTAGIFKNRVLTDLLRDTAERVRKGQGLSRALALSDPRQRVFTPTVLGMIRAGESGDTVAPVLDSVAEGLEVELSERISVLTSLIEPVLILFIGCVVAFAVLSIVLPIFQFSQIMG